MVETRTRRQSSGVAISLLRRASGFTLYVFTVIRRVFWAAVHPRGVVLQQAKGYPERSRVFTVVLLCGAQHFRYSYVLNIAEVMAHLRPRWATAENGD